jgi:hypothetical protein
MRNEFIDNMVVTMLSIIPRVHIPVVGLKVLRGYNPIEKGKVLNGYERKYGYALAICLGWEDWTVETALLIGYNIIRTLDENIHVVLDESVMGLCVYRKMKDKKIIHRSNNKNKILESF